MDDSACEGSVSFISWYSRSDQELRVVVGFLCNAQLPNVRT